MNAWEESKIDCVPLGQDCQDVDKVKMMKFVREVHNLHVPVSGQFHGTYFWVRYQNQPYWLMSRNRNLTELINRHEPSNMEALEEPAALAIMAGLRAPPNIDEVTPNVDRLAPYEAVIRCDHSVTKDILGNMLMNIENGRLMQLQRSWGMSVPYPKLIMEAVVMEGVAVIRVGRLLNRRPRLLSAPPSLTNTIAFDHAVAAAAAPAAAASNRSRNSRSQLQ